MIYAIRKSPKLDGPAIFVSQNDAESFLYEADRSTMTAGVEYQAFQDFQEAVAYLVRSVPSLLRDVDSDSTSPRPSKKRKTATDPSNDAAGTEDEATSTARKSTDSMPTRKRALSGEGPSPQTGEGASAAAAAAGSLVAASKGDAISAVATPVPGALVLVIARKGPLGIVLRADLLVESVSPSSSLCGTLFPGDRLVKINVTNVETWTSDALVKHLAETANEERVLQVYRPPQLIMADETTGKKSSATKTARKKKNKAESASSAKRKRASKTEASPPTKRASSSKSAKADSAVATRLPPPPGSLVNVTARKGPLGIKILEGLLVAKVNKTSSLYGKIFLEDRLVKINDTNVEAWSVERVVEHLTRTADHERVLQVFRPPSDHDIPTSPSPASIKADPDSNPKRFLGKFDMYFQMITDFKDEYGDTDVPTKRALYRIGDKYFDQTSGSVGLGLAVRFLRNQLKIYAINPGSSFLTKDEAKKLRGIDLCMNPKRGIGRSSKQLLPAWDEERYKELVAIHEEHGDCLVPHKPKTPLFDWVERIRLAYRDLQDGIVATITDEQIEKLTEIGFDWSEKRSYTFEEHFQHWRDFKMKNNGENPKLHSRLGMWIYRMRKSRQALLSGEKSRGVITQEQINILTLAGFHWESKFKTPVITEKRKTLTNVWRTSRLTRQNMAIAWFRSFIRRSGYG
jgi:hypothetical protein